jgi:hypothetical protein
VPSESPARAGARRRCHARDASRRVDRDEFLRYKALGEGAIAQLADDELAIGGQEGRNSVAVICRHLSGNFRSRFSGFLTSDGEKPWRDRDREFDDRSPRREELLADWEEGWRILNATLEALRDDQLDQTVTIRRQPCRVIEALHRSLAHAAYHVGQIVYIAKALRGSEWATLSIPRGGSAEYNRAPTHESPQAHASTLADRRDGSANSRP